MLKLADSSGLVDLEQFSELPFVNLENQAYQMVWSEDGINLHLQKPEARKMIWQVSYMIDLIAHNEHQDLFKLKKLAQDLSQVWSEFIANCNFCGDIAREQPQVAIARVWLIALLYQLLCRIDMD